MTIFSLVSNESIFENILEKFYEGEKDEKTIELSKVKQKKITNS